MYLPTSKRYKMESYIVKYGNSMCFKEVIIRSVCHILTVADKMFITLWKTLLGLNIVGQYHSANIIAQHFKNVDS